MNSKKINIAIPVLSLRHHGGIKILISLANSLAEKHDVTFLIPKNTKSTNYKISENVKIIEIETEIENKYINQAVFLFRVIKELRNFDLIIANFFVTYYPSLISSLTSKSKFVYFVQGIESIYRGRLSFFLNTLAEITYKSKSIIAANPFLQNEIVKRGGNPILTITVGVDDEFLNTESTSSKKYDIVYFARRESWKNLSSFIKFTDQSKIKRNILVVTQDLKLISEMKGRITKHNISYISPKNTFELIGCLDSSRILVSTSLKEGFSLPPLEAMSRGLVVILYPSGGPEMYVKNKVNAHYYTEDDDIEHLVDLYLSDENKYKLLSIEAKKTAKSFAFSTQTNLFMHKIEKIIEAPPCTKKL